MMQHMIHSTKLQIFDNTRIYIGRPHSLMFVCQNLVTSSGSCFNFQVTRDFARQFTYYQSLNCCLALITIIMPPAATLQTQIRGPSYCPSITKYAYIQHGGRNCKFINFEIVTHIRAERRSVSEERQTSAEGFYISEAYA